MNPKKMIFVHRFIISFLSQKYAQNRRVDTNTLISTCCVISQGWKLFWWINEAVINTSKSQALSVLRWLLTFQLFIFSFFYVLGLN